jgi:hypothetical protein
VRQSAFLSPETVVVLNSGMIDAEVDGEVVALSIEQGTCYGLNRVGSRIWKLIENPIRISDLCAALLPEYSVEPDVCEREVLEFLEQLRAEGMISLIPQK